MFGTVIIGLTFGLSLMLTAGVKLTMIVLIVRAIMHVCLTPKVSEMHPLPGTVAKAAPRMLAKCVHLGANIIARE